MTTNYRGFMSNAHDTKIMSSYVDENYSNGLKQNSKLHLGYDQVSYKEVTTKTGRLYDLPPGGKITVDEWKIDIDALRQMDPKKLKVKLAKLGYEDLHDVIQAHKERIVSKQYRMNELPAEDVLAYGADDTICTSALYNFYQLQMEIEKTFDVFTQVEVKPAYLTALSYTQGVDVSVSRLKELERADDKVFEKARATLTEVLYRKGILDKMWKPFTEWTAAGVKDACEDLFGFRPESARRKPALLAMDIMTESGTGDSDVALANFCSAVEREDVRYINELLLNKYRKEPGLDVNSSKKMKAFLYDILKLPVRVTSDLTELDYKFNRDLVKAIQKFKKALMADEDPRTVLNEQELALVKTKASTNDTAVDFALMYDKDQDEDLATILDCISTMKKVSTRRGLYYKPYPYLKHWKDGKLHSSMNQCATVTRRYSSSGPNLQQLPKKGEGIKIREAIVPHHRDAVIVSLDFSGQELRLAAHMSQDRNMLACYIGDNLKDPHSITAAGAMLKKWGADKVAELKSMVGAANFTGTAEEIEYTVFIKLRKWDDEAIAKLADDLRKVAKNVNFGAQYDAQALTLAYTIVIPVKDAQDFLDAREKMFPGVTEWKDSVRARVERTGYAMTLMGARRHLARLLQDRSTANKAGRQGPNFEIQGSSAEQTKLAMARVWDSGVLFDYDCRFVAPVHDELVFSIHKDHAVDAIRIIHDCMTRQYHDMTVPCMSSISLGPNFGEQIECGDWFIEENIRAALDKVFNKAPALEAA
jgi:DNA polymerase I-like protein with 3'-5' exonuclease and polymerase domains